MTAQRPLLSAEEVWQAYDRMEARLTAPLSERMLDLARVGPGMRILDGRGVTRRDPERAFPFDPRPLGPHVR